MHELTCMCKSVQCVSEASSSCAIPCACAAAKDVHDNTHDVNDNVHDDVHDVYDNAHDDVHDVYDNVHGNVHDVYDNVHNEYCMAGGRAWSQM